MEDCNVKVEMPLNETEQVSQPEELWILPAAIEQRLLAVTWPRYSCASPSVPDEIRSLMYVFLFTFTLAVLRLYLDMQISDRLYFSGGNNHVTALEHDHLVWRH